MSRSYQRSGKAEIPGWWLAELLRLLEKTTRNTADLAEQASELAGRKKGHEWGPDAVSKFKTNKVRTHELALGLGGALGLVPYIWIARSKKEAELIQKITEAFSSTIPADRAQQRAAGVDEDLTRLEYDAKDQSDALKLRDEEVGRVGRGRRVRRVTGRGTSST